MVNTLKNHSYGKTFRCVDINLVLLNVVKISYDSKMCCKVSPAVCQLWYVIILGNKNTQNHKIWKCVN